ncbi:MAG: HEPN domain-containing protein [bacterium]|nr:HEPN domain-containing protein [bacterium]
MASHSRIEYEECIKQGLLRKVVPSHEKAGKGIIKANKFLEQARKAFNIKAYDSCLLTCYQAIFLSAKSVLLKDGYREKSHACVARYLEENYVNAGKLDIKWVGLLDRFRDMRHDDEYNVFFMASKENCEEIMKFADSFIGAMEKILSV